MRLDPNFRVEVPTELPGRAGVRSSTRARRGRTRGLRPRGRRLAAMFAANFEAYADGVSEDVRDAGPRVTPDELEAASEGLPGDGSPLAG